MLNSPDGNFDAGILGLYLMTVSVQIQTETLTLTLVVLQLHPIHALTSLEVTPPSVKKKRKPLEMLYLTLAKT